MLLADFIIFISEKLQIQVFASVSGSYCRFATLATEA